MKNKINKIALSLVISFAILNLTGCGGAAIGDAIGDGLVEIGDGAGAVGNCVFGELILGCIL